MRTLALAALAAAMTLLLVPAAGARHDSGPLANATGWVKNALAQERGALAALNASPPDWHQAWLKGSASVLSLDTAEKNLRKTPAANELTSSTAFEREDEIGTIKQQDLSAVDAINRKNEEVARTKLLAAIAGKLHLIKQLTDDGGTVHSKTCEVEKPFDVFAVPAGYAGSYADVFPHGVPKNAKNMTVAFVDLATGKAPATELFPGQTWTSKIVGFLPDGRLQVHVDVSGAGFGKPDGNSKHWKVVVTYDC